MAAAIAIDGPAGAGKSTIAKKIAQQLKMIYVDTGAMYRAIGLYFHRLGVAPEDGETIGRLAQQAEVSIAYEDGKQQVYLNGENVTAFLRTEEAGNMASAVSVYPQVRQMLVRQQQKLAAVRDVVMDGRDIGTVVLPKADVKIFLTASTRVRAERRCEDLKSRGLPCDMELVEKDIIDRDWRDTHRAESPLRQAEDAVLVDTSDMTIDQVADRIIEIYRERQRPAAKTEKKEA